MNLDDSKKDQGPLRVLIIDAYTNANIGSCALVENSIKILESKFDDCEIRVMAHNPQPFTDLYNKISFEDIFRYPLKQSNIKQLIWLLKTTGWMLGSLIICKLLNSRKSNYKNWYPYHDKIKPVLWADLVVSVGAERLNDKFYKTVPFSLFTLHLAKVLKKKMVIFPSTIGPFFFWWSKWMTKKVLDRVDLIYTRDNLSNQIACDLFKLPMNKVINTSDVAVLQQPIKKIEALAIISSSEEEKIVGISAMHWSYFKNRIETPYSNYEAYVREMAITADNLINDYDVTVVFYPTNFLVQGCSEDDVATSNDVFSSMKNNKRAKIISKLYAPSQLQGMLACSQVNITTRMHACILSTNTYVPTISVNYLFKLKEYMDSLGLAEFSIDIEEFCSERAMIAFTEIWPEREKWRLRIEKAITQKRNRLWKSMEALDALV